MGRSPAGSAVSSTGVEVPSGSTPARVADVLAEPDRSADDRALDEPRQAAEVLSYLDVTPGMNVAVLAPGSGYSMELIARSVGLEGRVFARNPPSLVAASGLGQVWISASPGRRGRASFASTTSWQSRSRWPGSIPVFLDHDYATLAARGVEPSAIDSVAWNALRAGGRFVARRARDGGREYTSGDRKPRLSSIERGALSPERNEAVRLERRGRRRPGERGPSQRAPCRRKSGEGSISHIRQALARRRPELGRYSRRIRGAAR